MDVHSEDSIALEFCQLFEGSVCAALLGGAEFEDARHLVEEFVAIGFVRADCFRRWLLDWR